MNTRVTLMIRFLMGVCLAAIVVGMATARADAQADFVPDEVVVKLLHSADLASVAATYRLDPVPLGQFGTRPIYRLRILDGANPYSRATELTADPRVLYAEPNFLGETPEGRQRTPWASGGDSGEYITQWAPAVIRLPEAHAITRGAGAIVAVLDTGVDAAHPALIGRLLPGYDFVDMDNDPTEVGMVGHDIVYGHGTHVAGIVALVAPEARILPVRVLDRDGIGNVWVLAEALAFAADPDGNPATDDGADVINLSLSTTRRTELLDEILRELTCIRSGSDDDDDDDDDGVLCPTSPGRSITVVAAAGNSGAAVREYPAAEQEPGLLAVAASTVTDTLASFSTFGEWVSIAAPGEAIVSSVPGGLYGTWSGTSMATPFVAGQAALIRAADPGLTANALVQRIVATAVRINAAVPLRIDVAASLGQASPTNGNCSGNVSATGMDNVVVPQHTTCTLTGAAVIGSIKVERGASLVAYGVTIKGNVQADGALAVTLIAGSKVEGNIQAKHGGSITVEGARVSGNVQLESNHGAIRVTHSVLGGDLQLKQNRGGLYVANNSVGGNVQCIENEPAPIGGANTIRGNAEGQCSGF